VMNVWRLEWKSANFPVLLLSIYWRGLTTRGAFIGGFLGPVPELLAVRYELHVATVGGNEYIAVFQDGVQPVHSLFVWMAEPVDGAG